MGLYEAIDNLQKKSEETRRKILVVLILVSFLLLLGLWFVSFKKQIGANQILNVISENQEGVDTEENKAELLGPIESLVDGLGLVIGDIKEKTDEFLSQTESILEESEIEQEERPILELPNN